MRLPTRPQRPCVLSNRRLRLLVLPPRRCYSQPPAPPIPINTRPPDARLPYDRRPRKGWAPPRTIAVLGGGLTGLVTAYRLAKLLPKTKITLYEASSRLGGWVDTEEIKDDQGRTILFERGARMVQIPREGSSKFDDVPFYHLIEELKLGDQVVGIARGTPMPSYIYYPDHLVQMPMPGPKTTYAGWFSILNSLRTEPIFRNLGSWLVHAVGTRKSETIYDLSHQKLDEGNLTVNLALPSYSLGVYYTRVFGDRAPVDNILSAMMHGIFGGDVWKLSIMRDPFGMAISRWRLPDGFEEYTTVDRGSADAAQFLTNPGEDDVLGQEWLGFSHMWFRDGFETLPRALAAALEKCDNVTIKTGSPVSSVRLSSARNGISVTDNKGVQFYDHAVSTLFAGTLASVTHGRLPSLAEFPAVTIQAVNLWYPTQGLNHPRMGAGYLIPQSVKHELNPEKALGVLFDSDRDLLRFRKPTEGPPPNLGTTFTVLLGGHHWDGIPADQLPTPEQAGRLAKAVVARHLGISDEHNAQAIVSTKLCRECIPQHLVNHWPRMETARHELDANFARHLSVVGPSYQMPGVFGSITAAYDLANFLAGKYPALHVKTGHFPVGPTGLSRFQKSRDAYFARKAELPLRFPEHIRRRPDSLWTRPMAWARKQGAR
ncbi:Protoporphyrinogen oxidase, partial [Podospora conica]